MKNTRVTESHKVMILERLFSGKSVNCLIGFTLFGCTKVNTRVSELLKQGYRDYIKKKPITVKNRFGKEVRVMQYSM